MKKLLIIFLVLLISCTLFARGNSSVGLAFGPSVSYYSIADDMVFSNELAIRLNGSNEFAKNIQVEYALGFNYPSICLVNGNNVGLAHRLTDFTVECGLSYIIPASSKVFMDVGGGLSFFMGARPLSSGERIYQYALNLDASFSTIFKINPVFGITLDLRLSAPLYIYSSGTEYKKHSSMTGFYAIGSVGFVYLYTL